MARLEQIISTLAEMFEEYANEDHKLNKEELIKMMDKEITNPEIKAKLQGMDVDKAIERIDKNQDGDIDIKEFCKCIAFMTKCCYMQKHGLGKFQKK